MVVQDPLGWWLLPLLLVLASGWFLSFTARRLDRLHHRVEATAAALHEQLARRARAAAELGARLQDAGLTAAATAALAVGSRSGPGTDRARERAESRLTQALRELLHSSLHGPDPAAADGWLADPDSAALVAEIRHAGQMVRYARRFHNDAVAQAGRVRRKRIVRWARLAGRAAAPRMVELDDADDLEADGLPAPGRSAVRGEVADRGSPGHVRR